jgi:NadR type nicotinamide-nucleotide adenylyltransferase
MFNELKHAVVIGKFYPFHSGHNFLIHSASVLADKVTVVVLIDTKRELMFDFETRLNYVKHAITTYSVYGPLTNVCVVPVYHQLETNYDSDLTWQGFADAIKEGVAKSEFTIQATDFVCADNSYGKRLSGMLDLRYVNLDEGRQFYRISATLIRNNPYEHWEYINNDVRSHFCKRIVFLGAESTGTSTLTNDVMACFEKSGLPFDQTKAISEYAREYIQNKLRMLNQNIGQLTLSREELEHFAKKQFSLEENTVLLNGCPLILCDTDAFASQIWHKRYFGEASPLIDDLITKMPKREFYVLTTIEGIPFEDDGQRDGNADIQRRMEIDFEDELIKRKFPYIKVTGSRENRVKQVMDHYHKLEKAHSNCFIKR